MSIAPGRYDRDKGISVAVARSTDPDEAVRKAVAQIDLGETRLLLAFVPHHFDRDALATALATHLDGLPVMGCTTAGEITPEGYESDVLLLVAFSRSHFRFSTMLVHPLRPFSISEVAASTRKLSARFQRTANWKCLALVFSDGLSKQEDLLVATLSDGLAGIPVFGGSAGDGMKFEETFVLHRGAFHRNAALLVLLETDLDFVGLGFDHFLPTEQRLVVTDAIPEERLVLELNGAPAAEEYARLVGYTVEELSPKVFAENPVLVRNGGMYHVRAIQDVAAGGALSFLSAIDDGLVLSLGRGGEILRTLEDELEVLNDRGDRPQLILGFDCYLRRLEIGQKMMTGAASDILRAHNVIGFSTYGEQHCGVHVNQTFVGVAFFGPREQVLS